MVIVTIITKISCVVNVEKKKWYHRKTARYALVSNSIASGTGPLTVVAERDNNAKTNAGTGLGCVSVTQSSLQGSHLQYHRCGCQ